MSSEVNKMSKYIDQLNAEKKPQEHKNAMGSSEYDKLLQTVRAVRTLKEPTLPSEDYQSRLAKAVEEAPTGKIKYTSKFVKRTLITGMAAVAAGVILFTSANIILPISRPSIASAMEKALKDVGAYHGIVEVVESNGAGENVTQSRREVWADKSGNYYIQELEGRSKGQVTVNNGQRKWQIRPEEDKTYIYEAFPDPYRFTFEIGQEVEEVKSAQSIVKKGEEMIAGRMADILEVTPDGGTAYKLWVDQETDLPLQRQSAMQNALQYTVTYTQIDFMNAIPKDLLTYSLPDGYEQVNNDQEQFVNTIEEAQDLVGFSPDVPENVPEGLDLTGISVEMGTKVLKFYYKSPDEKQTAVVQESKAEGILAPVSNSILGKVKENTAEILTDGDISSIRWQEQGNEYKIFGNVSLEKIAKFTGDFAQGEVKIPSAEDSLAQKPQIEVPVDLSAEENDQKSVDAGHSPWKLDPAFVAQVYASLLISPEGIVGDYPIPYDNVKIVANNGKEAIAEISTDITKARYVYLKRLVRQDETGIWTVVGYDPADE